MLTERGVSNSGGKNDASRTAGCVRPEQPSDSLTMLGAVGMSYQCTVAAPYSMTELGEGFEVFLGQEAATLLSEGVLFFTTLVHEADRGAFSARLKECVEQGGPFSFKHRLRDFHGQLRWVWTMGQLVHCTRGEPFLSGFIVDVSMDVFAEWSLRQREIALKLDLKLAELAKAKVDEVSFIQKVGALLAKHFEWVSIKLGDLRQLHGRVRDELELVEREIQGDGELVGRIVVGFEAIHPNYVEAQRAEVLLHLRLVSMQLGWLVERQRAERQSIGVTEVARQVVNYLPLATVVWLEIFPGEFELLSMNLAAERLFEKPGRSRPRELAVRLWKSAPKLMQHLKMVKEGESFAVEITQPEGAVFGGRLLKLTYAGVPSSVVLCHIQDITEDRAEEENKKQIERLEAGGHLAGCVAHDFNNMLSAINGYAELALADELDPSIQSDLKEILHAGKRAAELTRRLMIFGRKQAMRAVPTDPNEIATRAFNLTKALIDVRKFRLSLAQDIPYLTVDPAVLEQSLVNLLLNARDATPSDQSITLETTLATLDEHSVRLHSGISAGDFVCFRVIDTGIGMSEEVNQHAVEPFFSTKGAGVGTGLGLATVYGFVKQSGGALQIESTEGEGTTVEILLPVSNSAMVRLAEESSRASSIGGETILVVEDEAAVRMLTERLLKRAGFKVVSASKPSEALALHKRSGGEIDLLLTDLVMPEMNGVELANLLVEQDPELRVVYMSGFPDDAFERQDRLKRARFLPKPFTGEGLLQIVRTTLMGEIKN